MKKTNIYFFCLLAMILLVHACVPKIESSDTVKLPAIFDNNMVLQRNTPLKFFGKAAPGKSIKIEFLGMSKTLTANEDSTWKIAFDAQKAGGPYEVKIIAKDTITFKNVMIGDVWLCSGQSNMEYSLGNPYDNPPENVDEEIANATYENIRLIEIDKIPANKPTQKVNTEGWKVCTSETVKDFSAVGYFFGREIQTNINIPVGLIQSAWGGTAVQPWMSSDTLSEFPKYVEEITKLRKNDSLTLGQKLKQYKDDLADYLRKNEPKLITPELKNWEKTEFDDSKWQTMNLPGRWENTDFGVFDGVVLYRKVIDVPENMTGKELKIHIGKVDDIDQTYINGEKVGTGFVWNIKREYIVPSGLLKAGKNVIAVQVVDIGFGGGIWGNKDDFAIFNSENKIPLQGDWKFTPSVDLETLGKGPVYPSSGQHRPTVLYNGMIAPLINYPIGGAIWYQGESNAGSLESAFEYRELFPAMIKDWRKKWQVGEFPFYFVQLANYKEIKENPVMDEWAVLRESQLKSLSVTNTGMAVAIDIGDAKDIHPSNKLDVGKRLAYIALNKTYKKDIPFSGPIYKSMKIEGKKIIISFEHVLDGLKTPGDSPLKGFAIAADDKKFVWADAEIQGNTIVVSSPDVPQPVAVRYAWSINPVCNLYNSADLPASPFRTDTWDIK